MVTAMNISMMSREALRRSWESNVVDRHVNLPVPGAFTHLVQKIMFRQLHQKSLIVLPSAACTVIVGTSGNRLELYDAQYRKMQRFEKGCLIGPHDRSFFLRSDSVAKFMVIIFYPGQFFVLSKASGAKLLNSSQPLGNIFSKESIALLEQLVKVTCPLTQGEMVEKFINLVAAGSGSNYQRTAHHEMFKELFSGMLHSDHSGKIKAVCDELNVNQKNAERAFQRYIGFGPKSFMRLKRYMHALNRIFERNNELNCTEIARQTGYHDLAHMTNEFKILSGHSPSAVDKFFLKHDVLCVEEIWFGSRNQGNNLKMLYS